MVNWDGTLIIYVAIRCHYTAPQAGACSRELRRKTRSCKDVGWDPKGTRKLEWD